VDDEPFDVRYGQLRAHERELDFRAGTLTRTAEWTAPTGRTIRIRSVRLVSFTQRAIAAVCYDVEPVDGPTRVVVQSELVANEPMPTVVGDPRGAAGLASPLAPDRSTVTGDQVNLVHRTKQSGLGVASAMVHDVSAPVELDVRSMVGNNLGRTTVSALLRPGERLRLVKFVAYGWSERRTSAGLRAQVDAALVAARQTGWDGLLAEQREFLDGFWTRADVELDGDPEVQQAVRFGLFHVAQAGARAERRAMPAKGLTGSGYDGHSFWDTEIYALPVLTYTMPDAARDALLWRRDILPSAQSRAAELGLRGAAFPWRTISGAECSAYWPAGTAAFHINAGIADAVIHYVDATGDQEFARGPGLDLLVNTARLWASLGHDGAGGFRIDGVTGPDEYSAVADNNVYTNLMARRNLSAAASAAADAGDRAVELGVTDDEIASWRAAAEHMVVPYDERLGVHQQSERFTEHQVWDFDAMTAEDYPLLLRFPYFDLYRKQVVKQADLVLAMYTCPDEFTPAQKAANFAYYEALTVRDSSLSACVQSVLAAEVGHVELARAYLDEAALMDLDDLEHNTRDGLHIASLAGSWLALVAGFGGMRHRTGQPLAFAPTLPPGMSRLAFRLFFRGRLLNVEITADTATYTLLSGPPIELRHYDEVCKVADGQPGSGGIPDRPSIQPPRQPAARTPGRR
jgi:alpha,alpha-trehalose phosphorylase